MSYQAQEDRYQQLPYRRVGKSGLQLPEISLGLWHNFGNTTSLSSQRTILRRAFDLGITHFDLANNYGTPFGSAESNFGKHMKKDFAKYRDELIISSKAGYDMWPGPYGEWGSRKYLLASLDQSLKRMQLDYVDIFYSHRFDPNTPLEETMGALATAVQSGRALYVGISSYDAAQTREAKAILDSMGVPLLIHQPRYSMFDRTPETALFDTLGVEGVGAIVFSPLAQGLLSDRYLSGFAPKGSRAAQEHYLKSERISADYLTHARALNEIAKGRGQSLSQLALKWVLRQPTVASALVGVSSVQQLEQNLAAISSPSLTLQELKQIDEHAIQGLGL
jgi:L-glyceraldehyde 3-phosphate reductase